jgi:FixJ family two-component response regulator
MGRQLGFTVFLVDDDESVTKGLSRLLRAASYETQAFTSPRDFLAAHDASIPGCAIVDLAMSDIDGLQLQETLVAEGSERSIIFLTGMGDIPSSVRAMKAGAVDFLTKPVNRECLLMAVAKAAAIDEQNRRRRDEVRSIDNLLATLTRREREVLPYVVAGRLNKQIAATIGTVEKTVKVHRMRMMTKLGVRCVADLVRLADRVGIPPSQDVR